MPIQNLPKQALGAQICSLDGTSSEIDILAGSVCLEGHGMSVIGALMMQGAKHTHIYIYIHAHTILHYIALHRIAPHYVTIRYIALHYIALHYITLHYITLQYIT